MSARFHLSPVDAGRVARFLIHRTDVGMTVEVADDGAIRIHPEGQPGPLLTFVPCSCCDPADRTLTVDDDFRSYYAAVLDRLVDEAFASEPERYGAVRSWTDLHGVCDANEFLQMADEATGADTLATPDLAAWAIGVVEQGRWGVTA